MNEFCVGNSKPFVSQLANQRAPRRPQRRETPTATFVHDLRETRRARVYKLVRICKVCNVRYHISALLSIFFYTGSQSFSLHCSKRHTAPLTIKKSSPVARKINQSNRMSKCKCAAPFPITVATAAIRGCFNLSLSRRGGGRGGPSIIYSGREMGYGWFPCMCVCVCVCVCTIHDCACMHLKIKIMDLAGLYLLG